MDRMFPVVYQQSLYDCGLACIKSLAHYYDKGYPNSASRDLEDIMATRCGISIADIRQELDAIGLESLPLECSIEDIISHSLLPGIALLKSNHYVIVYAVENGRIKVADPTLGCVQVVPDVFAKDWYQDNKSKGIFIAVA